MKLSDLLDIAYASYQDGLYPYYNSETKKIDKDPEHGGDTLAQFVVVELVETFDEDADDITQLEEAMDKISTAISDLDNVWYFLHQAQRTAQTREQGLTNTEKLYPRFIGGELLKNGEMISESQAVINTVEKNKDGDKG